MPRDAYRPCIYYKTNHDFQPCKKRKEQRKQEKRNPCRKYSPQRLEIVRNFGFLLKKAESADNPKKSAKKLY